MATRDDINHPLDEYHAISSHLRNWVNRRLAYLQEEVDAWCDDFEKRIGETCSM